LAKCISQRQGAHQANDCHYEILSLAGSKVPLLQIGLTLGIVLLSILLNSSNKKKSLLQTEVSSWKGRHAKDLVQATRDFVIAIDCTRRFTAAYNSKTNSRINK